MPDLSRLNFGAPAAERDVRRGLDAYFIESAAYRNMNAGTKTILVANRGAGKSAILKTMAHRNRDRGESVIELSPEDYSYEFLSGAMIRESEGAWAKLGAYAVAWKYLLLVLIMKELTKRHGRIRRGAESQIYAYLRDNHHGGSVTPFDAFVSYLRRIESVKVGRVEGGIRARELQKLYRLEELDHLFVPLGRLCARAGVTVLVDELDRGWDASEDAQAFVAGLFQACMTLNDLSPRLRVYMSLRQELYDNIPALYDDAQKFRDLIEVVRWDEPQLWRLIACRIRHTVPGLTAASDDQCWAAAFHAPRWSFRFIVDRSLRRPREIIQYCSHALDHAQQVNGRSGLRISRRDITAVEATYSGERTRDIAAEYRFQYPGLLSVFEAFRGRRATWTREDLELLLLDLATGSVRISREATRWTSGRDPDQLLEVLWNVGFLREYSPTSAEWDDGNAQVPYSSTRGMPAFAVHPMFRQHVGTQD
ncbi:P-loop ATPase, Sll1717 family [Parafrankia sp. FMc2]|uniref:P-loop ATPase, Sll1717 family n=1 Tax=Parafrankia sp. FMc2 TaxID=3233196 RepID=UPI0034D52750